jgi:hypothetical protein
MGITEENEFDQSVQNPARGNLATPYAGQSSRRALGLALAAQDGPPWGVSVCRMC